MAFLQDWLLPLGLVAAVFYAIYRNRLKLWRATARTERQPGKAAPPTPPAHKPKEPRWVPIQSAIGSDRPLVPAAHLLRRNGVEARIVRASLLRGRRLMRLVIRQTDVRRAREIMSKEDLYIKSRLES